MDFANLQILIITFILTIIPAISVAYLLDIRRSKKTNKSFAPPISREEIILLGLAWVFGVAYFWFIFTQNKFRLIYALLSLALVLIMLVSRWRRLRIRIEPKIKWYLTLISLVILMTFIGIAVKYELMIWVGVFLLVIIMIYEIWSRILKL